MSTYIIGDIHGCYDEFIALLKKIKFTPKHDKLWITGDLVSRGNSSLEVLRYIKYLNNSVHIVLGNHDLHLLAVFASISINKPKYKFKKLLEAIDANELLNWLRCQPILQIDEEKKLVMAHAGIYPKWNLSTAKKYACDIETILASDYYKFFLKWIYKKNILQENNCNYNLSKLKKLQFITNAFTRMRYCLPNFQLDMYYKKNPENAPTTLKPWFSIPGKLPKDYSIVFGHWASLKGKYTPKRIYGLDTGCCWGGELTCLRWEDKTYFVQPSFQNFKTVAV